MTADHRFEQDLPDLGAARATARPDYRDDIVQQTARMRQRPAWTFPERWLPMDITLAPARGGRAAFGPLWPSCSSPCSRGPARGLRRSRPHRVPAPFGPAVNGSSTSPMRAARSWPWIRSPPRRGRSSRAPRPIPIPPRRGTAGWSNSTTRPMGRRSSSWRTRTDRTSIRWPGHTRTGPGPSGRLIARRSGSSRPSTAIQAITWLRADGSGARTLALGRDILTSGALADGRIALAAADEPGRCRPDSPGNNCGLFVAGARWHRPQRVLAASGVRRALDTSLT